MKWAQNISIIAIIENGIKIMVNWVNIEQFETIEFNFVMNHTIIFWIHRNRFVIFDNIVNLDFDVNVSIVLFDFNLVSVSGWLYINLF